MRPSRATRLIAAVIAVISLLFTQLALASYVCPDASVQAPRMAMAMKAGMAGMSHCAAMDKAQPGLCLAHGHADHQSLDKPDLPQIPPFQALGQILTVVAPDLGARAPAFVSSGPALARATAPPLAIRYCCFRI